MTVFSLPHKENGEILCKKFTTWLDNALPNEAFCYYTGPHVAGNLVGRLAYRNYEAGQIELVQKRSAEGFEFWAQKTTKLRW